MEARTLALNRNLKPHQNPLEHSKETIKKTQNLSESWKQEHYNTQ